MKCQECIITELIESIDEPATYLEVGVLYGETLVAVAQNAKNIKKCIGIDSYEPYVDELNNYYYVGPALSKLNLHTCMQAIKNSGVSEKIELIVEDSHTAKNKIADNSIDVIYIDKSLTATGVKQDLLDWWPKVKIGGYLTGHEWENLKVRKIVTDTILELCGNVSLNGSDNVWTVKKPL